MKSAERESEPTGINYKGLDRSLDAELRWLLVNYTSGEAETFVRRLADRTGIETWRLIKSEIDPQGGFQETLNLTHLMRPDRCNTFSELNKALRAWDELLRKEEARSPGGEVMADRLKAAALTAMV